MFHLAIGARSSSDPVLRNDDAKALRRWESKFTSDPLVYRSSGSDEVPNRNIFFPANCCEVKLFRDYGGLLEGVPFDILPAQRGCRILMLGIPCNVSLDRLISGRGHDIKYYSELPRQECSDGGGTDFSRSVLFVFVDQAAADTFFRDWHIQFFDLEASSGPVCYLVFIDKMCISFSDSALFHSCLPIGSQQIPSCPFCIERIDVSVSGVVTSRRGWLSCSSVSSRSCVACSNLKSQSALACSTCGDTHSGLWLCLLCGNLGCGRYAKGHANVHSKSTDHRLSLEIATGRIWDYVGDLFVHRRIVCSPEVAILDLPERTDATSLPVHPQVSFEEDLRELDKTMAVQLKYEQTKYEEACTQLRILGASRVHVEEELLRKEMAQEAELATALERSEKELEKLEAAARLARDAAKSNQQRFVNLKQKTKERNDALKQVRLRTEKLHVPQPRLDELARLEAKVAELRLKVSSM